MRGWLVRNWMMVLAVLGLLGTRQAIAAVRDAVGKAREGGLTPETLKKIEEAAGLL